MALSSLAGVQGLHHREADYINTRNRSITEVEMHHILATFDADCRFALSSWMVFKACMRRDYIIMKRNSLVFLFRLGQVMLEQKSLITVIIVIITIINSNNNDPSLHARHADACPTLCYMLAVRGAFCDRIVPTLNGCPSRLGPS